MARAGPLDVILGADVAQYVARRRPALQDPKVWPKAWPWSWPWWRLGGADPNPNPNLNPHPSPNPNPSPNPSPNPNPNQVTTFVQLLPDLARTVHALASAATEV